MSGKRKWGVLSAAAILVALGMSWHHASKERDVLKAAREDADKQAADVRKYEDELKKLAAQPEPMAASEARLQRLARVGRDRGRMLQIYTRLMDLKQKADASKPLFGIDRRVHLTNLYVSRQPFTLGGKELDPIREEYGNNRLKQIETSTNLQGAKGFYADFAKASNVKELPPELRADAPIVVVLSGEILAEGHSTLDELKETLEAMPEVSDVRANHYATDKSHNDFWPQFDWDGLAVSGRPARPVENIRYTSFHLMFRWNPKDDPDVLPKVAQAAPAGPAAKGPAKAPAKKAAPKKTGE